MTRSSTLSVEIAAEPDAVFEAMGDIEGLPRWALGFVDAVEVDAETGGVTGRKGESSFALRVLRDPRARTVDFLVGDATVCAYARIVPTVGGGAAVAFTLPVPPDAEGRAAAEAVLRAELQALKALVEDRPE